MSTSATIAGLGAFGAGTVIAAGLKNQLDRVDKLRDRHIQAAEDFLNGVAAVIALQASVYLPQPPSVHWPAPA